MSLEACFRSEMLASGTACCATHGSPHMLGLQEAILTPRLGKGDPWQRKIHWRVVQARMHPLPQTIGRSHSLTRRATQAG